MGQAVPEWRQLVSDSLAVSMFDHACNDILHNDTQHYGTQQSLGTGLIMKRNTAAAYKVLHEKKKLEQTYSSLRSHQCRNVWVIYPPPNWGGVLIIENKIGWAQCLREKKRGPPYKPFYGIAVK